MLTLTTSLSLLLVVEAPPLRPICSNGDFEHVAAIVDQFDPKSKAPEPRLPSIPETACPKVVAEISFQRARLAAMQDRREECKKAMRTALVFGAITLDARAPESLRTCFDAARAAVEKNGANVFEVISTRIDGPQIVTELRWRDASDLRTDVLVILSPKPLAVDLAGEALFRERSRTRPLHFVPELLDCEGAMRSYSDCAGSKERGFNVVIRIPNLIGSLDHEVRIVLRGHPGGYLAERLAEPPR
ncbi:MAG: hypothetical protein HY791_24720 [Deltaproteobacteria bacterium]|nr:hypothetical protein [Deltaproteobacteria bacterium]